MNGGIVIKIKKIAVAVLLSIALILIVSCDDSESSSAVINNEEETPKQIVSLAFVNIDYINDPTNINIVALEEHTVYEELTGDNRYINVLDLLKQNTIISENYTPVKYYIEPSQLMEDSGDLDENQDEYDTLTGATSLVGEGNNDESGSDEQTDESEQDVDSNNNASGVSQVYTSYNKEINILNVGVEGNKAIVNFSSEGLVGNAMQETLLVSQVAQTLIRTFEEIEIVFFMVDSKEVNTLMGNVNVEKGISDSLLTTESDLEKREE